MRVIGGSSGGQTLYAPRGNRVRPTPERVREALFNILAPIIEDATFLDAYAGVGAVGIEALSRGASLVDFIEADRGVINYLQRNLERTGLRGRGRLFRQKVERFLRGWSEQDSPYEIVFADPPYELEPSPVAAELRPLVGGLLVFQAAAPRGPAPRFEGYLVLDERVYNRTALYFLRPV